MKLVREKIPFPMPPCLSETKREEFMAWALKTGIARMRRAFPIADRTLTVVGYGPSLADTWQKIRPPLITTSGALKFLLERGMEPHFGEWYHADCDPRPHKIAFITPPHPQVVYLMASVCNPKTWNLLRRTPNIHILMWHAVSGEHTKEWVRENDPDTVLVGAGSTIGLSAIHLGGLMGFRKFELHGFDGSFRDGHRHAGPHEGFAQGQIPSGISPGYITSKIMENSNVEMQNTLRNYPIFCVFHGDGAVQDWVRRAGPFNAAVDGTPKADIVRDLTYKTISHAEADELMAHGIAMLQ